MLMLIKSQRVDAKGNLFRHHHPKMVPARPPVAYLPSRREISMESCHGGGNLITSLVIITFWRRRLWPAWWSFRSGGSRPSARPPLCSGPYRARELGTRPRVGSGRISRPEVPSSLGRADEIPSINVTVLNGKNIWESACPSIWQACLLPSHIAHGIKKRERFWIRIYLLQLRFRESDPFDNVFEVGGALLRDNLIRDIWRSFA